MARELRRWAPPRNFLPLHSDVPCADDHGIRNSRPAVLLVRLPYEHHNSCRIQSNCRRNRQRLTSQMKVLCVAAKSSSRSQRACHAKIPTTAAHTYATAGHITAGHIMYRDASPHLPVDREFRRLRSFQISGRTKPGELDPRRARKIAPPHFDRDKRPPHGNILRPDRTGPDVSIRRRANSAKNNQFHLAHAAKAVGQAANPVQRVSC